MTLCGAHTSLPATGAGIRCRTQGLYRHARAPNESVMPGGASNTGQLNSDGTSQRSSKSSSFKQHDPIFLVNLLPFAEISCLKVPVLEHHHITHHHMAGTFLPWFCFARISPRQGTCAKPVAVI